MWQKLSHLGLEVIEVFAVGRQSQVRDPGQEGSKWNGMEVRQEEIVVRKHGVVTEDLLSWG